MPEAATPVIPTYITVHLGEPDAPAENITIPFIEYIKNVASSEIYPTWPENAIRANILAQISFALNRIYTEYYRSRGYDFDITNSTKFDQKFTRYRDIFENISQIVDDIFNDYIVKQGSILPFFAQYCDGRRVTCEGLSQWGTVPLAEDGLTPYEILQHYYGDDINIVFNAPVSPALPSYPGVPLRLGSAGDDVRTLKIQLNRISDNYPAIPKITRINRFFDVQTEDAVKEFQRIFNLTPDGIVGKATWYKIKNIYNGIKNLSELYSENLTLEEVSKEFPRVLQEGDNGIAVSTLQYYLDVIGYFNDKVPVIPIDGIFGPRTKQAVIEFQQAFGLTPDGIVGRDTWNKIVSVYQDTINSLPAEYISLSEEIYPGRTLSLNTTGDDVVSLQKFLNVISQNDPQIPEVQVTGTYDTQTENAVKAIQARNNLPVNGVVGPVTWNTIINEYKALR